MKSNIVSLRNKIFNVTREVMGVSSLDPVLPGFGVSLEKVITWSVREMRLQGHIPKELVFNLKIDGRPFCGKHAYGTYMVAGYNNN